MIIGHDWLCSDKAVTTVYQGRDIGNQDFAVTALNEPHLLQLLQLATDAFPGRGQQSGKILMGKALKY